ncbi:MAG: AarF/ABC1/UbiB kinase family protein [Alphaproteobacteria bacterium]|nr:MAG: AarF/ABC1/UbiB kinase family protein [Alphaproteobacteria bacterium]
MGTPLAAGWLPPHLVARGEGDQGVSDENNFGGRIKRYAQVTGAVGGLGLRLAGERYLGLKLDRDRHAAELKAALGGIKGPLMKVAQILSTIPDALPKEYVQELAQLQANAPSMGWPFVRRRMAAELGPQWQQRFARFEPEAIAAASLGQVHRAWDHDGTALAVKLQYPDMSSAVEADLRQLRLVFSLYERYDKAIATDAIHAEISDRLREELDYARELRHLQLYRRMLRDEPRVHVPHPVPALSTQRLLTMHWLDGTPLMQMLQRDQSFRDEVAISMFRAWYVPFYFYGVIHGDPHLGNYAVRPDAAVNLLDFGCIRVFRPDFVRGVIDLRDALEREDDDLAVHSYQTWGFEGLTRETIAVLNQWARFIYAPLLDDSARKIAETNSGQYGREVAEAVHAELRRIGGVKVPREFVFMDRAAIGLGSVFMHLKAEVNWYRQFMDLVSDFDEAALATRQAEALTSEGVPLAA